MMFLKNYTSQVPVSQTVANIERVLVKCRVLGIQKEYGPSGELAAMTFTIPIPQGPMRVRLPANAEAVLEALWDDYRSYTSQGRKTKSDFKDQAERTAWKLVSDWIQVQLSLIEMRQADIAQVFMSYAWDGQRTFYQAIKDANYKGLLKQ